MTRQRIGGALAALALACITLTGLPRDELPPHEVKRIRDAAPDKARVEPKGPRRVLIWNTPLMETSAHKDYCIPYGTCAMRTLGEKTGAFEPVVSDDLRLFLPQSIRQFDAIVMNNSDGEWIRPSDAAMEALKTFGANRDEVEGLLRKSLLDFVAAGGGIVAYHFAIGGNRHWPEFQELLGAAYAGHPWHEEVGVRVEESDHPLLAAFGGQDFRLTEEIFQFKQPYSRERVRVLLALDTQSTNMNVPWIERKDGDFALAWVRSYGKGRVFYTAFGHRAEIYSNPVMLRFYLDAIQFAAGGLPASTDPQAAESKGEAPSDPGQGRE